ncbi:hypothetical protein BCV70DRAFT_201708 [Testicularia cyperi]|uniref:Serine hydrolase domain-containing protein n=1 Tax=Testicularia cyperi TaxID=1882483 RepID=A0A317XJC7_9BASI|nr:hypothetical protein BCV70DRAFT_201708 [Testicularia cyperi]
MPPFDGLICFSQGCAVATGMLLNQFQADEARHLGYPVRFVVLICGSRPPDGKMGFVSTPGSAPIALPSIHVQGLKDSALAEQKRLSALYDNRVKMVLELDIAHHPPRRTSDVDTVAEAIHKLIDTLEPREARP